MLGRRETLLRVTPVGVTATCALLLAWVEYGSFVASVWLPYAVFIALVFAVFLASGAASRPSLTTWAGAGGLLALALWDAFSLIWSAVPSLARDEALLAGLYAVALLIGATTVRTTGERLAAVGVVAAGLSVVTVATFVHLLVSENPVDLYNGGRLYFPIDYVNAQAALFLLGFWPAVSLASRRSSATLLRGLAVGAAASLLCGFVLTQSKGGALALVVSAVVVLAVSPARLRVLVPTLVAAGGTALALRPLTEPFRADREGNLSGAIHHAGTVALVVTGAAVLAGLAYAALDRRLELTPRARQLAGLGTLGLFAVVIAAGFLAFAVKVDRPANFLQDKWHEFKALPQTETTSSHFLTLGSNRYDFWRVALNEFREHPVAGIGARSFGMTYLQASHSNETPQRAHSLELDELAEGGLVGFVLLGTAILVPLAEIARRARGSLLAAGVLGAGVYWLVHATVDWTWTFPAATLPVFVLLGIGLARDDSAGAFPWPAAAASSTAVIALLIFMPPWLAGRLTQQALRDPKSAEQDLRWARRLDPLSIEPLLAQANIAGSPGDVVYLRRAVEKEPRQPGLRYQLGVAYLEAGRLRDARRELREALRLHPHDQLAAQALRRAS